MTGCCADGPAATSLPRVSIRIRPSTSAVHRVGRSRSWRPTPAGCWAARVWVRHPPVCIRARCICIRARVMSSTRSISRTASRLCTPEDPGYATFARELTDIVVTGEGERKIYGPVTVGLVPVSVTNTVIGYLRRRLNGEVIDFVELEMPTRTLDTTAVMCTITPEALQHNGIDLLRVPGALHAAEHAAIGLLPLVASCDRGDIGGVSTAVGPVRRIADDIRLRRVPRRRRFRGSRIPARSTRGGPRRPRRSRHASARSAARRACSRRSAAAATIRSTKRAR